MGSYYGIGMYLTGASGSSVQEFYCSRDYSSGMHWCSEPWHKPPTDAVEDMTEVFAELFENATGNPLPISDAEVSRGTKKKKKY